MRRIAFKEFKEFLFEEGYTIAEMEHLYRAVKKFNPTVKKWFFDWFLGEGYPSDVVEGVTIKILIEEGQLKPINAFIVMDWLMKDPKAAKFALTNAKAPLELGESNEEYILSEDLLDDGISE